MKKMEFKLLRNFLFIALLLASINAQSPTEKTIETEIENANLPHGHHEQQPMRLDAQDMR
jgi:hypothetical protein